MKSFCWLALLFICGSAWGETAMMRPSSNSTKTDYAVGEKIEFEISLAPPALRAAGEWGFEPKPATAFMPTGSVIFDTESLHEISQDPNSKIVKISLWALASEPGPMQIPKFKIVEKHSGIAFDVETQANLKVQSILSPEEQKKSPEWFQPPVEYGGFNKWLVLCVSIISALIIGFIIYKIIAFLRRKLAPINKNPKEVALDELSKLHDFVRDRKVHNLEQWKIFAYRLANILKIYIDHYYKFPTSELTDKELLQRMREHGIEQTFVQILSNILSELDQVRYGTKDLEVTSAPRLLGDAKRFVEATYREAKEEGGKK